MAKDLTPEITAAIQCVLERFGCTVESGKIKPPGSEEWFDLELTDTHTVNQVLEQVGADIYLLCAIGSWRDTFDDQEVLDDLQKWLAGGKEAVRPNPSFARVDED
jgi:hypothetical protein